eukprot:COSAG01_NODE_34_length_34978_cov_45.798475_35_plen_78_part_00
MSAVECSCSAPAAAAAAAARAAARLAWTWNIPARVGAYVSHLSVFALYIIFLYDHPLHTHASHYTLTPYPSTSTRSS